MIVTEYLVILIILISTAGIFKPAWQDKLAFIPYKVKHEKQWYRFYTCALVHANFLHLFVNMYVLRFFGKFVERDYATYFGSSIEGILFLLLFFSGSLVSVLVTYKKFKNDPQYIAVGASGAISAVVFTVFMYRTFSSAQIGAVSLSISAAALLYLIYSVMVNYRKTGDVNHDAHLYGALYGIVINIIAKPGLILTFWYGIKDLF